MTIIISSQKESLNYNFFNFSKLFNLIDSYLKNPEDNQETVSSKKGLFFKNLQKDCFWFYNGLFNLNSSELDGYDNNIIYVPTTHLTNKNLWIIKPSDLCQGKGMKVYDDLTKIQKQTKQFFNGVVVDDIIEEDDNGKEGKNQPDAFLQNLNKNINNYTYHKSNQRPFITVKSSIIETSTKVNEQAQSPDNKLHRKEKEDKKNQIIKYFSTYVIIQKYIENPCLYYGRKFDIRIWVLVNHESKVYMFKEGHIKTSSKVYDLNSKNTFVHITNYTLQKQSSEFSKFEYGNEASIQNLNVFFNINDRPLFRQKIQIMTTQQWFCLK